MIIIRYFIVVFIWVRCLLSELPSALVPQANWCLVFTETFSRIRGCIVFPLPGNDFDRLLAGEPSLDLLANQGLIIFDDDLPFEFGFIDSRVARGGFRGLLLCCFFRSHNRLVLGKKVCGLISLR